jgi:TP901-1 family phage major tail protein
MAGQAGKDFLLKVGTAASGTTVAAMRTTRASINGEMLDATNKDSADLMRELVAGGGVKSVSIEFEGVLTANAQASTLAGYALDGSLNAFGLVFDGGDKWDGSFQLTRWEMAGEYNGVQTYAGTLESSGDITVS